MPAWALQKSNGQYFIIPSLTSEQSNSLWVCVTDPDRGIIAQNRASTLSNAVIPESLLIRPQ